MIFGINGHKCHLWYFNIVSSFTRLTAREITYNNLEISLVVFIPNITTDHAITYTNSGVSVVGRNNRPFNRYRCHIELIGLRSIMGCFSGQFFFRFSLKIIVMGKKDRCAVFGCNNDHLYAEKYTLKFSFCPKSARKYWASAPWASHNTPQM